MGSEELSLIKARLESEAAKNPQDPPTLWDPAQPWSAVFLRAATEDTYWNTHVINPANRWLAKGRPGSAESAAPDAAAARGIVPDGSSPLKDKKHSRKRRKRSRSSSSSRTDVALEAEEEETDRLGEEESSRPESFEGRRGIHEFVFIGRGSRGPSGEDDRPGSQAGRGCLGPVLLFLQQIKEIIFQLCGKVRMRRSRIRKNLSVFLVLMPYLQEVGHVIGRLSLPSMSLRFWTN